MENQKPKYKFSIFSVSIIFLVLYLIEISLGTGIFFNFIIPTIASIKERSQNNQISSNFTSHQLAIYDLLEGNELEEASTSAQKLLSEAKSTNEQALGLQVSGEVALAQNNNTEAERLFKESINLSPIVSGSYIGLANIYMAKKDYKNAVIYAQRAIELAPTRYDYYFILGLAQNERGDKNSALKNLEKAYRANPNITEYKNAYDSVKNGTPVQTPTPNSSVIAPIPSKGPDYHYTKEDISFLNNELSRIDSDINTINQSYKGISTYNQQKINRILEIMPQRKIMIQKLLTKMNTGQPLNNADYALWADFYDLTQELNNLVSSLSNGKGGN